MAFTRSAAVKFRNPFRGQRRWIFPEVARPRAPILRRVHKSFPKLLKLALFIVDKKWNVRDITIYMTREYFLFSLR